MAVQRQRIKGKETQINIQMRSRGQVSPYFWALSQRCMKRTWKNQNQKLTSQSRASPANQLSHQSSQWRVIWVQRLSICGASSAQWRRATTSLHLTGTKPIKYAILLLLDATQARYMLSSCVCACMSVTHQYCVKTAKLRITQQCHTIPQGLWFYDAKDLGEI